jgi:hypothetical protein
MLIDVHGQHTSIYNDMAAWIGVKRAYLTTKEDISSSPAAQYHLSVLGAYNAESLSMQARQVPAMADLSGTLRGL